MRKVNQVMDFTLAVLCVGDKKNPFYLASLLSSTEYRKLPPEISHYCKTCNACVAMKSGQKQHKAPLGQYLVGEPMERVALDILGPLPFSTKGNKYILVLLNGERL